jgi:hypothetical protein
MEYTITMHRHQSSANSTQSTAKQQLSMSNEQLTKNGCIFIRCCLAGHIGHRFPMGLRCLPRCCCWGLWSPSSRSGLQKFHPYRGFWYEPQSAIKPQRGEIFVDKRNERKTRCKQLFTMKCQGIMHRQQSSAGSLQLAVHSQINEQWIVYSEKRIVNS